ncbi:C40 family peptidase [Mesoflavibacter sp. CH_XMU1404-2]|uniref:C40 family peptidase n=1 Tax=Mesoflavibacter sp. CH_XMU1404-2 TaxID=3107766 RepID=UPI00300A0E42
MKRSALILLLLTIFSCGGSKNRHVIVTKKEEEKTTKTPEVSKPSTRGTTKKTTASTEVIVEEIDNALIEKIIKNASTYEGVKYKYGGTTKKGMDCSGLMYTVFSEEDISLPRTTSQLSTYGDWVDLKEVKEGDLLFFATKRNSRQVNHVGLVTSARLGRVEFIHASTSRGVIRSLLSEKYWYFAFVQARRIL